MARRRPRCPRRRLPDRSVLLRSPRRRPPAPARSPFPPVRPARARSHRPRRASTVSGAGRSSLAPRCTVRYASNRRRREARGPTRPPYRGDGPDRARADLYALCARRTRSFRGSGRTRRPVRRDRPPRRDAIQYPPPSRVPGVVLPGMLRLLGRGPHGPDPVTVGASRSDVPAMRSGAPYAAPREPPPLGCVRGSVTNRSTARRGSPGRNRRGRFRRSRRRSGR
jgi:hypothetical protein